MKRTILLLSLLLGVLLLGSCASQAAVPAADEPAPEPIVPEPTPDPADEPEAAPVPEPDAAERRLASMTREEKVCQLLMLCSSDEDEVLPAAEGGAGGLCLYAASFADKDKAAVLAMTEDLQARSPIPLLLAVDEEGGTVCRVSSNPRLRAVPFAAPRYLYEQGGWALIESDTAEKAQLLRSLGLNVNLAPVADVPLSWQNYIYARSFSTDPSTAAAPTPIPARPMTGVRWRPLRRVIFCPLSPASRQGRTPCWSATTLSNAWTRTIPPPSPPRCTAFFGRSWAFRASSSATI